MRLLLISSEFPPGPGGIGSHAYQLALHLERLGWEVVVMSPQDYAPEEEIFAFNQIQHYKVVSLPHFFGSPLDGLYRLAILRRWVTHWRPQVLLASGERSVWLTALFSHFSPKPWLVVGHGLEFGNISHWQRYLTRRAFCLAHSVICVSEYTRSRMFELGVHPKNERVIPNGADEDLFHPVSKGQIALFRQQLDLGEKPLLLTVGNVTERKGQDVVIRALPELLKYIPEVHYLLAGLPTLKKELTNLAKRVGVEDRVHFLGRLDSQTLVTAYNACDVYVMTSRHSRSGDFEGYGIAAVEAALCGRPAVVSGGSGLEEAIEPDKTGLVVPEDDPSATAAAIARLLQDESLRRKFGLRARERALQEQTWASRVAFYDQALHEIVSVPKNHIADPCQSRAPIVKS